MKKIIENKRKIILLIINISCLIFYFITRFSKNIAEFYTMNIYKWLSIFISFISGIFPFSLAELVIILIIPLVSGYIIYEIVKLIKSKGKGFLISTLKTINIILLCLSIFLVNCGVNYNRVTFSEKYSYKTSESSYDEFYKLCKILAEKSNSARAKLNDEIEREDFKKLYKKSLTYYNKISEKYPTLTGNYSSVKSVYFSNYMSYTHITGFYFPFTIEANINIDVPFYRIPSTICHEIAHLNGYMSENEANFISHIVAVNSGDSLFEYSSLMNSLMYCMSELYNENTDAYWRIFESLDDNVIKDIRENNSYWSKFETKIAEVSNVVNDTYLKANGQESGVKSYGEVIDLLLVYYKDLGDI